MFFAQTLFAQSIDTKKEEIYSKLKCCPCKESFATCTCPEAKEMKAYIDALLEGGLSKEDIFKKIAKKFSLKVIIDEKIKADIEKELRDEAGPAKPIIVVESSLFDFGQVNKKQGEIKKVLKILNGGTADLIITNLKTSCGCVSVSLSADGKKSPYFGTEGVNPIWRAVIKPSGSAELEIKLDLTHPSIGIGKVIREIFITSNDPAYPETGIIIEANVR
jgi:hypothetical protein